MRAEHRWLPITSACWVEGAMSFADCGTKTGVTKAMVRNTSRCVQYMLCALVPAVNVPFCIELDQLGILH